MQPQAGGTYRFGVFELDRVAMELRKRGVLIKLQDQPFRILCALLDAHGEIVSREAMKAVLWPEDTFVEFERSMNAAVAKLRQALGDSAENPRFIETLPRRGYRLIVSVVTPEAAFPEPVALPVIAPQPVRRARLLIPLLALTFAGVLGGTAFWFWRGRAGIEPPLEVAPLTTYPGFESNPSISPDGNQVAFSYRAKGDNSSIYIKLIGSSGHLRLTTDPARDEYPVWSPDGRSIAFLHTDPNGNTSIREVSALGGAAREVAQLGKDHANPGGWTPDGQWLLVSLREQDKPFGLFLLSVESGEKRRLTAPAKGFEADDAFAGDYYSSLSPDGRTVAFARMMTGGAANGPIGDLYVLPLKVDSSPEGEPRRLTFDNATIQRPAWTAASEIIFSLSKGGAGALWRMPASGAEKPRRLSVGENSFSVAFSPRSNRLVYEQQVPADRNIWRLDLSSPAAQPSSWIASTRVDSDAQYSPDGKRITFRSDRSGTPEIWACDADSSNAVKLTTRGEAGSPDWSPDGSRIAFDSTVEGRWQIFVVSAQGGKAQQLTFDSRNTRPRWAHDGMWIYYASTQSGRTEIWKLPVSGGKAIQLTRNGGNNPVESVDGTAIYYHSGKSLMKAAVDGSGETRVLDGGFFGPMAAARDGIYYTAAGPDFHPDLRQVRFLSFSKGTSWQVLKSEKPPGSGLGLSPDGRWLLYTQLDGQPGSDLMLAENFH